jgi:hypothetical protein
VIEHASEQLLPPVVFPEPMNMEQVHQLQPGEFIMVKGRDRNSVFRTLGGEVVKNHKRLQLLNYLTGYLCPPAKETLELDQPSAKEGYDPEVHWLDFPCTLRHPTEKELTTLMAKKASVPAQAKASDSEEKEGVKVQELSAREIALALLEVISSEPKGRVRLCKETGLDIDLDSASQVLEALLAAGKIRKHLEPRDGKKLVQWRTV